MGQMEKDLEGLAKPVGLGYSCAGDLGTSQKEEAKEMGAGAQMWPTASYGRKPPSSVSRGRGSPVLLSITQSGFPGPPALSPAPWASWWRGGIREQAGCSPTESPFPCCLPCTSDPSVFPHLPNKVITDSLCDLGQVSSLPLGSPKVKEGTKPETVTLCLSKFSEKMRGKALPLGSFPVGGMGAGSSRASCDSQLQQSCQGRKFIF